MHSSFFSGENVTMRFGYSYDITISELGPPLEEPRNQSEHEVHNTTTVEIQNCVLSHILTQLKPALYLKPEN